MKIENIEQVQKIANQIFELTDNLRKQGLEAAVFMQATTVVLATMMNTRAAGDRYLIALASVIEKHFSIKETSES